MRKTFLWVSLLIALLSGCALPQAAPFNPTVPLGSLWKTPVSNSGGLDWESAPPAVLEQHSGYLLADQAIKDVKFDNHEYSEGNQQDDVQMNMRKMVETDHVFAVLGASSNAVSMRAASLVNFFSLPMVIPAAVGDNLLPANNLWVFRLSAPGSAYAGYLFGTLIKNTQVAAATPSAPAVASAGPAASQPALKLAIIYEADTFGESAAVASAHAAMNQSINIVTYASFPADNPDLNKLNDLASAAKTGQAQLVYLISSDPSVAKMLVSAFRNQSGFSPLLIGQAGGFANQVFLASPQAEGVYILRQELDHSACPTDITSSDQAQNFAAVNLLDQAVLAAEKNMPHDWWNPFPIQNLDATQLSLLREKVRDAIKVYNADLPCMGKVAFDNTGQNKLLRFELITVQNKTVKVVPVAGFQQVLPQAPQN